MTPIPEKQTSLTRLKREITSLKERRLEKAWFFFELKKKLFSLLSVMMQFLSNDDVFLSNGSHGLENVFLSKEALKYNQKYKKKVQEATDKNKTRDGRTCEEQKGN